MDPNIQQPVASQQVEPPYQEQSASHGSWLKIGAVVLGVVVLLSLVGGAYVLGTKQNNSSTISYNQAIISPTQIPTPTSDPTASWQTYTDSTYHFSIKYPPDFQKSQSSTSDGLSSIGFQANTTPKYMANSFSVTIIPNPNQLSVLDYLKTVAFKDDLPQWHNADNAQPIVLPNNISAVRIEKVITGAGGYGPSIYGTYKNFIFNISGGEIQGDSTLVNSAISTFKFTQ